MSIPFPKILKLSLIGLKINKTRTVLSALWIVIGVAAVIIIVSVGEGLKALVVNQISAMGTETMSIDPKIPGSDYGNSMRSSAEGVIITTLKESDAMAIRDKKRFPYVVAASGYLAAREWATYEGKEKRVLIIAADSYYPYIDGQMKIEEGRLFTEKENEGLEKVAVVGSDVAKKFFGDDNPVGKQIKIKQINFKVIGVLKSRGIMFGFNMDEVAYIPVRAAQKLILGIDHLMEIGVKLENEKYFPQAKAEISQLMRQRHHIDDSKNDDFEIITMDQAMDIINSVTGAISLLLGVLAAISLLVGGIGIMNIMLVVVTEKTKEIGLRKALGAKQRDVLSQFISESIMISLAGGIIGIIFGVSVSYLITYAINSYVMEWPFVISYWAVFVSFFVAAFLGILFGWYPARKAARLNPIDALRYE